MVTEGILVVYFFFFFFKQKTAYEIVSRDWSSDVCSSDLRRLGLVKTEDWKNTEFLKQKTEV